MDLLFGLRGKRELAEFQHLFNQATVVEEMLVALHHMQVSVCTVGRGSRKHGGMTNFRKNIISFPQELNELKQLVALISSLEVGDIVNVRLASESADAEVVHRAKVHAVKAKSFQVEVASGELHEVGVHQIAERLKLPWKPINLRDYLIILRRRNASRDDYVEDLRVRRDYIRKLLRLLTKLGDWRD